VPENDFGKFLKALRKKHKGTQIAKQAGISYVYLLDIEKGARPVPSNKVLLALAESFNLKNEELEMFFNLAATQKNEIPLDIANFIKNNRCSYSFFRTLKKLSLKDEQWESLEKSIINHFREV